MRPALARMKPNWTLVGVLGAMATAWLVRSLLAGTIFLDDGFVLLGLDDSAYHARRALYSFVNFPSVLLFDPYMAYPDGSPIPFPPLYDWLIAAVARGFGDSIGTFEIVAAWAATLPATLTILPVFGMGRCLAGPRVGVAAAWIFAVLPASSLLSSVGYLDHHAAVSFLAACWLWSSLREIRDEARHRVLHAVVHAAIVAGLMLVWSGSLLYVALGEGSRLLVGGVLWSRRDRLLAQCGSALLAAAFVAPWVAAAPHPVDGAYSSTALSWLHVIVLCALGALTAGLAGLERLRPEPRGWARAARALGLSLAIGLPLLIIPGLADTLVAALDFVSGQDVWAAVNPEQQPLFSSTPETLKRSARARFGWFAYLVPLFPLLVAARLRDPQQREITALFLCWTTLLTVLALRQVRFAHDLAPLASVIFAGAVMTLRDRIARRLPEPAAAAIALAVALVLLWPALSGVHMPRLRFALQPPRAIDPTVPQRLSPWESEVRFAIDVREATPETSGYLDAGVEPEYGLLVDPSYGHSFLYSARRPVPANNFGQYIDRPKFDDASRFYTAMDASVATALLDRLGTRYLVTNAAAPTPRTPYSQRLHRGDGYRGRDPVCGPCLRLVTEGPMGGTSRGVLLANRSVIPFKLFERVAGAVIEVEAPPGTRVELELDLETPLGRSFVFEDAALSGADGWARLRVPHATDTAAPVHAQGLYRVRAGDAVRLLEVPEEAVRNGGTVVLTRSDGAP